MAWGRFSERSQPITRGAVRGAAPTGHTRRRRGRALAAAALIALAGATGALAHGDPSSHYLETQDFLSSYASPPAAELELELLGLVEATRENGYPVKVTLIASADDSGGDPGPVGDPQAYAELLASELGSALDSLGPVIVVTPNGLGVSGRHSVGGQTVRVTSQDVEALVGGIDLPAATGDDLAQTAMLAVRQVADAGGHTLPAYVPPADNPPVPAWVVATKASAASGGSRVWPLVGLGVLLVAFLAPLAVLIAQGRHSGEEGGVSSPTV